MSMDPRPRISSLIVVSIVICFWSCPKDFLRLYVTDESDLEMLLVWIDTPAASTRALQRSLKVHDGCLDMCREV